MRLYKKPHDLKAIKNFMIYLIFHLTYADLIVFPPCVFFVPADFLHNPCFTFLLLA